MQDTVAEAAKVAIAIGISFQDFDFVVAAFCKTIGDGCCIGVDDTAKPVLHGSACSRKLRYFAFAYPVYPVAKLLSGFLCIVQVHNIEKVLFVLVSSTQGVRVIPHHMDFLFLRIC